jgi:hypothetical protein
MDGWDNMVQEIIVLSESKRREYKLTQKKRKRPGWWAGIWLALEQRGVWR